MPDVNRFYQGDARAVCEALPNALKFDLVYLDPPFGVGTKMTARTAKGESRGRQTKSSGPMAYVDETASFDLATELEPRLAAVRDRMNRAATIYVHLDHRSVHEVKVLCDRLFGKGAYLGEVIWCPGNGGRLGRVFPITHQTLLIYVRSAKERKDIVFQRKDPALREPYAKTSLSMHFTVSDGDGRLYRERVIAGKTYRYYADEGRALGSVWTDIPAMRANTPLMREGTGYPTQKPEALLDRIVRASSLPGAVVADLMCGSGTTLLSAARLGRRFVGGDIGAVAVKTTRKRLEDAAIPYSFHPLPGTQAELS